jgi:hypothetical protein
LYIRFFSSILWLLNRRLDYILSVYGLRRRYSSRFKPGFSIAVNRRDKSGIASVTPVIIEHFLIGKICRTATRAQCFTPCRRRST